MKGSGKDIVFVGVLLAATTSVSELKDIVITLSKIYKYKCMHIAVANSVMQRVISYSAIAPI